MTGKIFINYRRGDDPGYTGRLFDRLQDVFEPDQLFLDVDNIAPGLDFVRVLNERVADCDVVLAVIGKNWIDARDQSGARRLDDPDDFVRIELASALDQDKRVIPVLVGGAPMPRPDDLPEPLRPLARRNAVRLTHERFRSDVQGLVKALQQSLEQIEAQRKLETEAVRRAQAEAEQKRQEAEAARLAKEEERRRLVELEAGERTAAERKRQEVEAEIERRAQAEAEQKRQEAEAARLAAEEERQRLSELEAAERAAAERKRQEVEARQRVAAKRAFAVAKRAGTVLALDAFVAAHRASAFADEAHRLRTLLLAREAAYRNAIASDDAAVLRSFVATYSRGADADEVRRHLRQFESRRGRQPSRALMISGALTVVLTASAAAYWFAIKSPPDRRSAAPAVANVRPPPSAQTVVGPAPDRTAWDLIKKTADAAALKRFVAEYPNSPLRKDAEMRLATLETAQQPKPTPARPDDAAWQLLKGTTDQSALRRFVAEYPNSPLRKDAEARIAALKAIEAAKPAPPRPDEAAWVLLKQTTDEGALKAFVAHYPDSPLSKDAEAQIAAIESARAAQPKPPSPEEIAWNLVKDSTDAGEFRRFIKQFPASTKREEAQQKIVALTAASPGEAPATAIDPHALALSLQFELRRVGCFSGALSGDFDQATRDAEHKFAKLASINMPDELSPDAV
ncbi:MAG: TIR domain-containing protein, partial [Xanthobacteraceae bacterium]